MELYLHQDAQRFLISALALTLSDESVSLNEIHQSAYGVGSVPVDKQLQLTRVTLSKKGEIDNQDKLRKYLEDNNVPLDDCVITGRDGHYTIAKELEPRSDGQKRREEVSISIR